MVYIIMKFSVLILGPVHISYFYRSGNGDSWLIGAYEKNGAI